MKPLPETEHTLLIRTDFTDDGVWEMVCSVAREMDPDVRQALEFSKERNRAEGRPTGRPIDELKTPLHLIDEREYENATCDQIVELVPLESDHSFLFIVDKTSINHSAHPLLVVDLCFERGRNFRAVPSEVYGIQSNLSLANMDWDEFADNVDDDGIFRGFA
jgi:hypothetical protein